MIIRRPITALLALLPAFAGCASGPATAPKGDRAIFSIDPWSKKPYLQIRKGEWSFTHNSWLNYSDRPYYVCMDGDGPVFKNPEILTSTHNDSTGHTVGTVTIDLEHHQVVVDVLDVLDNPRRTVQHPLNGTYPMAEK